MISSYHCKACLSCNWWLTWWVSSKTAFSSINILPSTRLQIYTFTHLQIRLSKRVELQLHNSPHTHTQIISPPPYTEVLTHRPRLKVLILEAPLLLVEMIILHILQHHLVVGVKQNVTGCTRGSVLRIIHCGGTQNDHIIVSHWQHALKSLDRSLGPYIYNKKTGGSDTWWPQTSPQRILPRWASGAPHTSPYTSAHRCRDLRHWGESQKNWIIFSYKRCRTAAHHLNCCSTHLPVLGRSPWTPRSHTSPRSPLSRGCTLQSTARWPAPCFGRCRWSPRCCRASRPSGKRSGKHTHAIKKTSDDGMSSTGKPEKEKERQRRATNLVRLLLVVDEIFLHVKQRFVVVHVLDKVGVIRVLLQEGVGGRHSLLHVIELCGRREC